jgi:proteasome-associated ATPase
MPRVARTQPPPSFLLDMLIRGSGEEPLDGPALQHLQILRGQSSESSIEIDRMLIERLRQMERGMNEIRQKHEELRGVIDRLAAPPYHPAIFLGIMETAHGTTAMVHHANSIRIVTVGESCDIGTLSRGDGVLLSHELNCILEAAPLVSPAAGETAIFDRWVGEDRAVLKSRDEEVIASITDSLRESGLCPGDVIRWDRSAGLCFEKIPASGESGFFLEHTPRETFEEIGGLDDRIDRIRSVIQLQIECPELVAKYRIRPKRSILLVGPPGTGKTMLARAMANWIAQLAPSGRSRFMSIKPGEMSSMWYGQSEAIIRQTFRVARDAGETNPDVPVVLFFDEVDSIGAARGGPLGHIDDKVLEAFMVELEGLQDRGNVLVVAATNRRDRLDSALTRPGRLGDLEIHIPRPGREAAREIFRRHLPPGTPVAANGNGGDPELERAGLIDAIVSRIFAQNGDSDLATVVLRTGAQRVVQMKDVISGALIRKISQNAAEAACLRERTGGREGITIGDLLEALDAEMATTATALTPASCRGQLEDLPQDVDVVRVDPIRRHVDRPLQYVRIEAA